MKIPFNVPIPNQSENLDSDTWTTIKELASDENREDAFYVCNLDEVVKRDRIWKEELPKVAPYYAVKCNDDVTVLEMLAALGNGFDCASKAEIKKVLSIGVNPDRIIFANPAKLRSHIRYAASVGVTTMTFDSEDELYKVREQYPDAKLVIRIRVEATDAQCPLGMKFGCDPVKEAPRLLTTARSLGLQVVGVSFHVGSGCREPAVFRRAIFAARQIFDYAHSLGYDFKLLDLGGGYPGDRDSSIHEIAGIINEALLKYFEDLDVRYIAEPGRYYVMAAFTLSCSVVSIRRVWDKDENDGQLVENHRMYYINDGVYGSFNCMLYDHQVVRPTLLKDYGDSKKALSSSIWGPTCDGLDQIIEEVLVPELEVGDWIVFGDMGAYTLAAASPFNGFPVPEVYYLVSENIWKTFGGKLSLNSDQIRLMEQQEQQKDGNEMTISNVKKQKNFSFLEDQQGPLLQF